MESINNWTKKLVKLYIYFWNFVCIIGWIMIDLIQLRKIIVWRRKQEWINTSRVAVFYGEMATKG